MDAYNIRLRNFVYQGGDDCIAIKPRSYNSVVQNMTCYGGNGPAIGSLGQYPEDASVESVKITDVTVRSLNPQNRPLLPVTNGLITNRRS